MSNLTHLHYKAEIKGLNLCQEYSNNFMKDPKKDPCPKPNEK